MQFFLENFGAILSLLGLGGGVSIFTAYYSRQQAKADISKSIQDVYQEMICDVKADRDELRKEIMDLRVEVYELRRLLPLICQRADCPQREAGSVDASVPAIHRKPEHPTCTV